MCLKNTRLFISAKTKSASNTSTGKAEGPAVMTGLIRPEVFIYELEIGRDYTYEELCELYADSFGRNPVPEFISFALRYGEERGMIKTVRLIDGTVLFWQSLGVKPATLN